MRLAIWTYTAAIAIASFAVVLSGEVFSNIYHYRLNGLYGKPLPHFTSFLLEFYPWTLAVPLPWLVAAIWLSRRDTATVNRTFAFAGVSTLGIVFLFAFTAVALALPFVTIIQ